MPGESSGARCGDKRKDDRNFLPSFMWCHQESNRGHKDFQSFALPTELWHLALDCECIVIAFCRIHQIFSQLFFKNFNNCDKNGCEGWVWRLQGAYLRHAFLDISAIPAPRMSPRPRVAKYGATHGCHPLPGIEITSPLHCAASKPLPLPMHRSTAPPSKPAPLHCAAHLRCLEARAAARGRKKGVHGGTP